MFQALIKRIARGLNKSRIPYMIIGGQAVLIYGEPRLTKDIDITLGTNTNDLERVMDIVRRVNLKLLLESVEDFVKKTHVLPVIDEKSGIRVDFIFSFSPYERQAIERAIGMKFGRNLVKFASLEDVVIHKTIAGRPRDMEDVRSILLKNSNYNLNYIEKWLKEFDRSLGENFLEDFRKVVRGIP